VSYDDVRGIREDTVYCSITGYGQEGVLRDRAGHELNYGARAGTLGLSRDEAGAPVIPGIWSGDLATGLMGAFAIASALRRRDRTGEGQYIDLAIADVLNEWLMDFGTKALNLTRTADERSVWLGGCAGHNVYRTRDGKYLALGVEEPKFWTEFCHRVGRPDLLGFDPLATGEGGRALIDILGRLFLERRRGEWEDLFADGRVPCDPVLEVDEALTAQGGQRPGAVVEVASVEGLTLRVLGSPLRSTLPAPLVRRSPPGLGQHTEELLAELRDASTERSRG
jgi:crotonobetainyl-CoA:carnitine CoA-transferase CaiB-like acyl-CoA transferase